MCNYLLFIIYRRVAEMSKTSASLWASVSNQPGALVYLHI